MKQKETHFRQSGFTIMELLVVMSIMAVIATVVILDFSRQRAVRSIVLAKNETVTNLRKVQSYMLSAKNIAPGVPAKFYIAEFKMPPTKDLPNSFTIQAVDGSLNFHDNLETVTLPAGVEFTAFKIEPPTKSDPVSYPCVQIIFGSPFGNIYANGAVTCGSSIVQTLSDPLAVAQLTQHKVFLHIGIDGVDKGYITLNPVTGQISTN